MRTFSYMDKHYDRHNHGICSVCGCTMWSRRKSICDSCRYEGEYIASLEVENANLRADNRSLVEQLNQQSSKDADEECLDEEQG